MRKIIVSILVLTTFQAFADDELKSENQWLIDFFNTKLVKATSEWMYSNPSDLNKKEIKHCHFDFETLVYSVNYELTYQENWEKLTKGGTIDPPKFEKVYPTSKVENWTKSKGEGTYKEIYNRKVPNWFVFKKLDTLVKALAEADTDPAISSIFWSDEKKYIRKLYRKNKMEHAEIWKQFTYTDKKQLVGVNATYLENRGTTRKSSKRREFSVKIFNDKDEHIELIPFISVSSPAVLDGIVFRMNNKKCILFNYELNERFYRFAPKVFRNPDVVLLNFLIALQKHSGKELDRLIESPVVNE